MQHNYYGDFRWQFHLTMCQTKIRKKGTEGKNVARLDQGNDLKS